MSDYNQISLENAEEIIERFGGIRPMANKMRVPVTTVQGWKKRNVIPGNRKEEIADAAIRNGIDLSDLPEFAANENGAPAASRTGTADKSSPARSADDGDEPVTLSEPARQAKSSAIPQSPQPKRPGSYAGNNYHSSTEDLLARMRGVEKKAVRQSAWIASVMVVVAIAAGAFVMWPTAQKVDSHGRRIADLERNVVRIDSDLGFLKEKQSLLSRVFPEDFNFEKIQEQAESLQSLVGALVDTADAASKAVLGQGTQNLPQRVERLEEQMQALGGSPQFAELLARLDELKQSVPGQEILSKSLGQLNALVQGMEGQMDRFDDALVVAREESEALNKTFEGIPNEDLEAAAMLLGLSQLRDSLNRGQTPFKEDLQLLLNMVGEENAELRGALERLAPHAEQGVLTPDGLSKEFRGLAGDIVVASLKGEDVSIQEKAKARLNEIFQIQKDGELLTGTDTQATVARAENKLSGGDLTGALAELQSLEGDAAQAAKPFINKAQAALQAQQTKGIIGNLINSHLNGSRAKYTTKMKGFSSFVPSPSVVSDPESGFSVLPQGTTLPE